MTKQAFKDRMRHERGKLTSKEVELGEIHDLACDDLIEHAIHEKALGIDNLLIVASLTETRQEEYCKWYTLKQRNKAAIDLWLAAL